MFGIEWTEYAVIAIVALIVIGPKELPAVLRAIGQWTAKIRRMASEFQGQLQEALREAEMADLKKEVDNLNDAAKGFTSQVDDAFNFEEATKWEPKSDTAKPDAAKPDNIKSDDIKSDDIKPDDIKPDDAAKRADAVPASPPDPDPSPQAQQGSEGDEEAFPVAAAAPATAQASAHNVPPSGAGGRGESNGATDGAPTPQVTPPTAAQPPLPEGSSQRSDAGGVHS